MSTIWPRALRFVIVLLFLGVNLDSSVGHAANASIKIRANNWVGGGQIDWFTSAAWEFGDLGRPGLPNPLLPTYFGPIQVLFEGIPTGGFLSSSGEAVLGDTFRVPSLTMAASGNSVGIRLAAGGLLDTSARVGIAPANGYPSTSGFQPTILIFDGGDITGSWHFDRHSKVVFLRDFTILQGVWNGIIGGLVVESDVTLTSSSINLTGTIDNMGVISLEAPNNIPTITIEGKATLQGEGSIILNKPHAQILSVNTGDDTHLLTNVDNVIRGEGSIRVPLVNRNVIRAEGGRLEIYETGVFDNSQGTMEIGAHGQLYFLGAVAPDHEAGRLRIDDGGRIGAGSRFRNLQLMGPGPFVAPNGQVTLSGTIDNPGTITFEAASNNISAIYIEGQTTLQGKGSVILNKPNAQILSVNTGDDTHLLTNVDNVIRGEGSIRVPLVNRNVIRAEGGRLEIYETGLFDNSQGTMEIGAHGQLYFLGAVAPDHEAGRLRIDDGGRIGAGSRFRNLQLMGPGPFVAPNGQVTLSGTIDNPGTITFEAASNNISAIYIEGQTTLQGKGSVILNKPNAQILSVNTGDDTHLLTNVDNVIRGEGSIRVPLVNRNVIRAEGGRLEIYETGVFDNSQGTLEIGAHGQLYFLGSLAPDHDAGRLLIEDGGRIGAGSQFRNLHLRGPGPFVAPHGQVTLNGTIDNPGVITFDANPNNTSTIAIEGQTTLQGGGSVILNRTHTQIVSVNGDNTHLLTNEDNVIRGEGRIRVPLVNRNVIRAEGGRLEIYETGLFDNSQGTLEIGAHGQLYFLGSLAPDHDAGRLLIEDGGRIGAGSQFRNLHLRGPGPFVAPHGQVTLNGTIDNPGVITFDANPNNTSTIAIEGQTTLQGGGSVILNRTHTQIVSVNTGDDTHLLTNEDNVIRGEGRIRVPLVNRNVIRAEGGRLEIYETGLFDNSQGTLEIGAHGQLYFLGSLAPDHDAGRLLIEDGGRIGAGSQFRNLHLRGPGPFVAPHGQVTLNGTIDNPGVITFDANPNNTSTIAIEGQTTLQGGGSVILNRTHTQIVSVNGDNTHLLTNEDNVIRGEGSIRVPLVNSGKIEPGLPLGTLRLEDVATFTEASTLEIQIGQVSNRLLVDKLQSNAMLNFSGNIEIALLGTVNVEELLEPLLIVDAKSISGAILSKVGDRITTANGLGSFLLTAPEPGKLTLEDFVPNKVPTLDLLTIEPANTGWRLRFRGELDDWVIEGSEDLLIWHVIESLDWVQFDEDTVHTFVEPDEFPQFFLRVRYRN